VEAGFNFFTHLLQGDYSPGDRLRMVLNNLRSRASGEGCCGNYGEPGC
jgi:hypothetical protein